MTMWLLTIASVFFSYAVSLKTANRKKTFLILSGILVVLILGSRYFINGFTDEVSYNYEFQGLRDYDYAKFKSKYSDARDFGFYFVYWILAKIFYFKQFPIFFITALFVFASFRFIYKNSEDPLMSVLLIFGFGMFSFYMAGYRQCFAMCFCLFAFEYAKKKKFLPYIILWAIAFSFHASAIIFLPMYWLVKLNNDKNGKTWIFFIIVILFATYSLLMDYAANWFDNENYTAQKEFSLVGFTIQIVIMLVPIVLHAIGVCEKQDDNKQFVLLALTLMGICFYALKLAFFSFERISYYYSFFIVASFPNSTKLLKKPNENDKAVEVFKYILIILLIVLCVWRMPENLTYFWNY